MAYLGEDIKKLGFGLMRLPKTGEAIDIEQTKKMVDMFLEAGFTYFDTAWAYPGSEDAIRQALAKIPLIPCTTCNYCAKVCPMNIGVSGSFTAMNYYTLYKDLAAAKHQENWLVTGHGKKKAAECIKCGACEKACPQHIKIREELVKVTETMG